VGKRAQSLTTMGSWPLFVNRNVMWFCTSKLPSADSIENGHCCSVFSRQGIAPVRVMGGGSVRSIL
jgi:hypothetical protein